MSYNSENNTEFKSENTGVDPAVLKVLPVGCTVISTDDHGVSFWANTGRIDVKLSNGESQIFFIKVLSNDIGKNMVRGEFESMSTIYHVVPEFIPRPIAWGSYEMREDTHFFLSEFCDMTDDMPDPTDFTPLLGKLHHQSKSPNNKFGFHLPTYAGNLPQYVEWQDSWETFFSKSMKQALEFEIERKGQSDELDRLAVVLFEKVIPRLLRPLESEGRSVKPALVHGDLWYANSGIDVTNGQALVFDACCFYAHNEYEFGQWRPPCNRFGDEYISSYLKQWPISKPEEDFYGRLDLYRLRFDTHVSALFIDNEGLRTQVIDVMRDLVERYRE